MTLRSLHLVIVGNILAGAANTIPAQTPQIAVERSSPESSPAGVLSRPVSVRLQRVPLASAIETIARQANVRISYRIEVVDAVTSPVSVTSARVPLGKILGQVLAGTPLQAVPTGADEITLRETRHLAVQGTITGTVIHAKTRQPVAGVTVFLGNETRGTTTGVDGTFRFSAEAGEHRIRVRGVGFGQQVKSVSVVDGEAIAVTFAMEPSTSVLDEVVVTGTVVATARKEIATPITVIHGEELERRGITRIEQLFRGEVPGLIVLERGSAVYSNENVGLGVASTVYSRGSASLDGSANPIKTYVDGVELVDPSYLGTIDPRSIEKIEIVTGPQAATVYGSGAMGGVMQIFTKRGAVNTMPEMNLTLKYGLLQNNFSDGRAPAHNDAFTVRGGGGPELTYSAGLSYDYTGQWQPKLYSRRYSASLGATHTRGFLTVRAAFTASANRQGTWDASWDRNFGQLQLLTGPEAVVNGVNAGAAYHSQQISLASSQTASLNLDMQATKDWQHHITLGKSQNDMKLKPVAPNYANVSMAIGADTLFKIRTASGDRFSWSYNTSVVQAISIFSSAMTLGASGSMGGQLSVSGALANSSATTVVGTTSSVSPVVSLPVDDQNWGAFGNWRVGIFKQLYTTLGVRIEQNPRYGRSVKFDMTPTNGLAYTFERGAVSIKLMGSYGKATRPPSPEQRLEQIALSQIYEPSQILSQFANPDLRPEYSRGPQGGIELYLGNLGSLTINHYQQTVTDLIQRATVDSLLLTRVSNGRTVWFLQSQYRNVAKVRQQGWEGTAAFRVAMMSIQGTYSWNESHVLSTDPLATSTSVPVGRAFYNLPTHTGNLRLGYARGLTSVQLVTNYVGQRIYHVGSDLNIAAMLNARHRMYTGLFGIARAYSFLAHPGYAKADMSASHRVTSNLTATVNIINIGNGFDSDIGELNPSLGRQSTFGFSYRFGKR